MSAEIAEQELAHEQEFVDRVYLQLLPLFRTKDFQEGMRSFLETRPPTFEGR